MNFFIYPDKFDPGHLHFGPAMENHMHVHKTGSSTDANGKFFRITHSTKHISLNNVGIVLHLHAAKQTYPFHHTVNNSNKMMVSYDESHPANAMIIQQLARIECAILDKYVRNVSESMDTRRCVHSITDHLTSGHIKVGLHRCDECDFSNSELHDFNEDVSSGACIAEPSDNCHGNVVVMIFGVWETSSECGLVYKFVKQ